MKAYQSEKTIFLLEPEGMGIKEKYWWDFLEGSLGPWHFKNIF